MKKQPEIKDPYQIYHRIKGAKDWNCGTGEFMGWELIRKQVEMLKMSYALEIEIKVIHNAKIYRDL
jgi:hypothetical protein